MFIPRQVPIGVWVILTRVIRQDMEATWAVCIVCRNGTTPSSPVVESLLVHDDEELEVAAKAVCAMATSGRNERVNLILLYKRSYDARWI